MVDQIQTVDQAVARLVDADFPVVAAKAQHFVVLAHEGTCLFDAFDMIGLVQSIIQCVLEVIPILAKLKRFQLRFDQLP
ncbi:hypothetical protein D9M71_838080 [compost metagenome]